MIECLVPSEAEGVWYTPTLGVATFAPRHDSRVLPGCRLRVPTLRGRYLEVDEEGLRVLREGEEG